MYTRPYQHLFDVPFTRLSPKHFFWSKHMVVKPGKDFGARYAYRMQHLVYAWEELYFILRRAKRNSNYHDVYRTAMLRANRRQTRRGCDGPELIITFKMVFFALKGNRDYMGKPSADVSLAELRARFVDACSDSFEFMLEHSFDFV